MRRTDCGHPQIAVDLYAEIKPTYILKDYSVEKEPQLTGTVKRNRRNPLYSTKTKLLFAGAIVAFIGVLLFAILNDYFAKKVTVPDLSAMTYDQAVIELGKLDLKYQVSSVNPATMWKRIILFRNIPKRARRCGPIPSSSSSSARAKLIVVPDVIGLYEKEATSKLTNAGFTVSQINYEYNDDYELGKVYQQNPSAPGGQGRVVDHDLCQQRQGCRHHAAVDRHQSFGSPFPYRAKRPDIRRSLLRAQHDVR
jgi:hypothetical protein